jgi:flagellar biosynthetic protein FlhB
MAEDTDDKTEDPTQKRLEDAHAKGDVAKSQEVNTWFVMSGATLVLWTFSGSSGAAFRCRCETSSPIPG